MSLNIDEQYRVKFLEKTVAELLDAVEALEAKAREAESAADELDYQSRRIDALQNKPDTFDGRCIVPEERVLRWERIERAARLAVGVTDACGCGDIKVHSRELREALNP